MPNRTNLNIVELYDANSKPYGRSYGEWTVRWWQWFMSTPIPTNPADGGVAYYGSEYKYIINENVCFLWGKVGDEIDTYPYRCCRIPASYSILFPVINCEANRLEFPGLNTEQALIDHVNADENAIIQKDCEIDGISIAVERVRSDPIIFELRFHPNNAFGVDGEWAQAAADGYWVFFKRLPKGKHTIKFRGKCEQGRLKSGADYNLQIV
jgi:hypothetical protein